MNKHKPKAWVAVDDWPLHEDLRMHGHFVQTRNRYGLQADVSTRRRTRCLPPVLTDWSCPRELTRQPTPSSYARVLPLDGGSRVRALMKVQQELGASEEVADASATGATRQ